MFSGDPTGYALYVLQLRIKANLAAAYLQLHEWEDAYGWARAVMFEDPHYASRHHHPFFVRINHWRAIAVRQMHGIASAAAELTETMTGIPNDCYSIDEEMKCLQKATQSENESDVEVALATVTVLDHRVVE